jgi:hypothetical protein
MVNNIRAQNKSLQSAYSYDSAGFISIIYSFGTIMSVGNIWLKVASRSFEKSVTSSTAVDNIALSRQKSTERGSIISCLSADKLKNRVIR